MTRAEANLQLLGQEPFALPTELGQPGVKGVLGKRHSEQCFGKGICQP